MLLSTHLPANSLLCCNSIGFCLANGLVAEHFLHHIDRDIIIKGNSTAESPPRLMSIQFAVKAAEIDNLLQVNVHFLVRGNRKHISLERQSEWFLYCSIISNALGRRGMLVTLPVFCLSDIIHWAPSMPVFIAFYFV